MCGFEFMYMGKKEERVQGGREGKTGREGRRKGGREREGGREEGRES